MVPPLLFFMDQKRYVAVKQESDISFLQSYQLKNARGVCQTLLFPRKWRGTVGEKDRQLSPA
ncbi:hypothetical protein D1872_201040 [compost metagenome]